MKHLPVILSALVFLNAGRAAESYHADVQVIPVLNDGSEATVLDFTLETDREKTLAAISFHTTGTTVLGDITELGVEYLSHTGNLRFATTQAVDKSPVLKGEFTLPKGKHPFRVIIRTKRGADLSHRVAVQVAELQFTDGGKLEVPPGKDYQPRRLAYPIHRQGEFDCHTFRIPAIARANNGDLLAVYDMRYNSKRDLQEHIDIGLSVSKDGGQTWADPRPIMDMGEYGSKPQKENGCSDPGILVDRATGEIFVSALWTHGKPNTHQWVGQGSEPGFGIHQSSQFMVVRSVDQGQSWSEPENWTRRLKRESWYLFAPAPGNGITMRDGTLVMPSQGRDAKGFPFSNITWSQDHGKTWQVSAPARDDTTECAVAELSDGTLMLNIRDNRNRKDKSESNGRAVAVSKDLGKTWQKHSSDHSALPEPTCMASLISHTSAQGEHLLFFSNPHHKTSRSHMTLQRSTDDGKSWPADRHVLLDTGRGNGYSSLVMIDQQTIGILYESSVADLVFQKIPLVDFGE